MQPETILTILISIFGANNTGGAFYVGLDNSTGTEFGAAYAGVIYRTGAHPITFHTNFNERMRIHSNGGLKFNPQSAAPTAEAGTVYYDSDDNKLKVYNGTSWVDLH